MLGRIHFDVDFVVFTFLPVKPLSPHSHCLFHPIQNVDPLLSHLPYISDPLNQGIVKSMKNYIRVNSTLSSRQPNPTVVTKQKASTTCKYDLVTHVPHSNPGHFSTLTTPTQLFMMTCQPLHPPPVVNLTRTRIPTSVNKSKPKTRLSNHSKTQCNRFTYIGFQLL